MDIEAVQRYLRAIHDDGRYAPAAFEFVREGLDFTARALFGQAPRAADDDESRTPTPRHVSGQQLCKGLRRLALRRWGLLAPAVLARWNIRATRDFGEIVFLLIELGLLGRQESDSIHDFQDVYDFKTAFDLREIPLDAMDE